MMRKNGLLFAMLLLIMATVVGCAQPSPPAEQVLPESEEMPLTMTSTAFADGANIPAKYTCDGESISPELAWAQVPAGTASFALIMEDPDAPIKNFTHWVIFNLPPDTQGLPEAVPKDATLANGALQGKNGGGSTRYIGPCPPKGSPHHYRFTLYAMDTSLDLTAGASKDQLLQAMEGHIIGQAQLIGLYQR